MELRDVRDYHDPEDSSFCSCMAGRGVKTLNYGLIKVLDVIVCDEKGSRRSCSDAKMAMHLFIDVLIP